MDDYLAGHRHPVDVITTDASVYQIGKASPV
jgi:hypothetical protein